ncbi:hypothetical protein LTR16_009332, partial [Cryomyces antarcticus]
MHDEEVVDVTDAATLALFADLKRLSRELVALVRLSSLLPRGPAMALSPILARRLELFIVRKEVADAGVLADFMANVVECTHEEKLRILSALSVKDRLERVVEIMQRQISTLQGSGRIATANSNEIDKDSLVALRQEALRRGMRNGQMPGGMSYPPGFPGGNQGGDEEGNEVEELKKRLDEAKLSPEAKKVADRELRRLQKMNPAQAEYQ